MVNKYCAAYPCPNLVGKGKQYCPEHEQVKSRPADKSSHHNKFYSTARWTKFRNYYISGHPLCEQCGGVGQMVDHIKEIKDGGAELDENNVQTLCNRCHAKKTRTERKKRGPKVFSY